MDLAYEDVLGHHAHVQSLKSYMIDSLISSFPTITFHGETDPQKSLYTVLNVCFPKTDKGAFRYSVNIQYCAEEFASKD
jgi:cysteine desulfurase